MLPTAPQITNKSKESGRKWTHRLGGISTNHLSFRGLIYTLEEQVRSSLLDPTCWCARSLRTMARSSRYPVQDSRSMLLRSSLLDGPRKKGSQSDTSSRNKRKGETSCFYVMECVEFFCLLFFSQGGRYRGPMACPRGRKKDRIAHASKQREDKQVKASRAPD
ncbi:hypothetical protein CPC08DRAFT_375576 [Agrocybe pediades]|nr:hypothetical protein CPC08DRAFT_375576 [Agrocybe pediades]